MTIATRSGTRDASGSRTRAFTLVEVMIATVLMVAIIAGVLSTALFMARGGFSASSYSEMEQEARRGLEVFARDVRMANKITWVTPNEIVLAVVIDSAGTPSDVRYKLDSNARTFTRTQGGKTDNIFTGVTNSSTEYAMRGYKLTGEAVTPDAIKADPAQAGVNTKEIQLNLTCGRTRNTVATASSKVISARFILRNKLVTSK